jgi:bifunctional enzyme CysN/CysC
MSWQVLTVGNLERASLKKHRPVIIWMTGLPGAAKLTIASIADGKLVAAGYHTMLLDGDNVRHR